VLPDDQDPAAPFTGVVTTGIYCRAGCPATPLRRNTRPFALAAAAEAEGLRPCLRCRPDRQSEPGWVVGPELVCAALRAIADGALDGATEDDLAARLGVSGRHLRRLFVEHAGATPAAVARSRRAHFARRLLDDTDLPVRDIAGAAGFATTRHLNRVVRDVFGFTPSELRARRRNPARPAADGGLTLRLPYRPPIAWDALVGWLAARAVDGVESVDLASGTYRRTITLGAEPGVLEIHHPGSKAPFPHLVLRAHLPRYNDLLHVVASVRRLLDLDTDPAAVARHLGTDRLLAPLVRRRPGLRVPGAYDRFETLVRTVLGEVRDPHRARRRASHLVAAHGRPVPGLAPLGLAACFPDPAALAGADLRSSGLPAVAAAAVSRLAATVADGTLALEQASAAEVAAAVGAIPGLGLATAGDVAWRLGDRDAFPAADTALRRVLAARSVRPGGPARAASGPPAPSAREAADRSEPWRPWRAYAVAHLRETAGPEN
jgi:AraC family transcriptional regulator of adaptative response / DNA-3-methyladenine glycosylase II